VADLEGNVGKTISRYHDHTILESNVPIVVVPVLLTATDGADFSSSEAWMQVSSRLSYDPLNVQDVQQMGKCIVLIKSIQYYRLSVVWSIIHHRHQLKRNLDF
jgi:hypothetical protein